jgi:two-component system, chemotaxis family, response regulator Rcp1
MDDRPSPRLILLLEPNGQHAQQLVAGFHRGEVEVVTIAHPEPAQDFLWRRGEFGQAERPDLILLNFAPADSQVILQVVKTDRAFRQIPVILLNQNEEVQHIWSSYVAQGNCYILKSEENLTALARQIEAFWLGIVTLPPRGH